MVCFLCVVGVVVCVLCGCGVWCVLGVLCWVCGVWCVCCVLCVVCVVMCKCVVVWSCG